MPRAWCCLGLTLVLAQSAFAAPPVDFQRDVRPLLSNACFKCHGPDADRREANLRLDTRDGATALLDGRRAVVPGDPAASQLVTRVLSTDPDERMPPPDSGPALTPAQVDVLKRWIAAGAPYERHWSFRPVARPPQPVVATPDAAQNPLDRFVLARLDDARLTPAPPADRSTMLRRLFLDLLGLPPSPAEVDRFLADDEPDAYDRLVDRVLAHPQFGERWGRHWLDQARYADTNGYSVDSPRTMWPFRDWVIAAINRDLPFDQFTIEQLAGDLLPNPSPDQLLATGFHRNTLVNEEGGTDREQFRNEAVVDRVNTTGAVWLGLTLGCAQCHNHKYDPVSQLDYYRLFAFFNQTQDVNSVTPTLRLGSTADQARLADLERQVADAKRELADLERRAKQAAPEAADEPARKQLAARLKQLQDEQKAASNAIPAAMVMKEVATPRPTHVLIRGDFLRRGEPVRPDVPTELPPLNAPATSPRNRLDLAQWLVDARQPLTPRVTANRVWMRFFGQGLVETENDFGLQGTLPTHPELLDWLASELRDGGWSLKRLQRQIVLSATYRQSAVARPDAVAADPLNRWLGRQSRLRVDAEIVRDLALAVSGLLQTPIGGPSVYPPQPGGVYVFTQRQASWPTSTGADRYRRGLYTFFMRSAPYPMLTTFDTPRLDTVCTRRVRSNTPLQALALANDQTMLEMARALGQRLLAFPADSDRARIEHAYRLCFARPPDAVEAERLAAYVSQQRDGFATSPADAAQFTGAVGPSPVAQVPVAEVAAWTSVARVLLSLDEFITRE